jgi:hypothetical protein
VVLVLVLSVDVLHLLHHQCHHLCLVG